MSNAFGPYAQSPATYPSLKDVEGPGAETIDMRYANPQAPCGINSWAGTDGDGVPLKSDGELPSSSGQEAVKVAAGKSITRQGAIRK